MSDFTSLSGQIPHLTACWHKCLRIIVTSQQSRRLTLVTPMLCTFPFPFASPHPDMDDRMHSEVHAPTPKPLRISKERAKNPRRGNSNLPAIPRRSSSITSSRQRRMGIPKPDSGDVVRVHKIRSAQLLPSPPSRAIEPPKVLPHRRTASTESSRSLHSMDRTALPVLDGGSTELAFGHLPVRSPKFGCRNHSVLLLTCCSRILKMEPAERREYLFRLSMITSLVYLAAFQTAGPPPRTPTNQI